MLWSAYEEVRAFDRVLRSADVETLHQLRIRVKRLRDDLDFLADVLGPERDPLIDRLVALQDHLGALNDAVVTAAAVQDFLDHRSGKASEDQRTVIAAYRAGRELEINRLVKAVGQPWRPVNDIGFARRLGRLVVVAAAKA
jgi:CHAD domain-containing protein